MEEIFEVEDEEGTLRIAEALARSLPAGSVVHLVGDLGLGKTRFAKGLARGLGHEPDDICSPTFTLVQIHEARETGQLGFVHVDLYRIETLAELDELGLTELPGEERIAAVEWPERLAGRARPGFVRVLLEDLGGTRRRFSIERDATATEPPLAILG